MYLLHYYYYLIKNYICIKTQTMQITCYYIGMNVLYYINKVNMTNTGIMINIERYFACLCMYVCMYLCMYESCYVCMYVYMYVCMYLSTHHAIYLSIYLSIFPPILSLNMHLDTSPKQTIVLKIHKVAGLHQNFISSVSSQRGLSENQETSSKLGKSYLNNALLIQKHIQN